MKWEPIRLAYPDDEEAIAQARQIHEFLHDALQGIDIPELASAGGKGDVIRSLPVTPLSNICTQAWNRVFGGQPFFDMEQALRAFINEEAIPELSDEKRDIVAMFVHPAVTLYLNALRKRNLSLVPAAWASGNCPFCLAYPRIALDSESSRMLTCLLCGQEWEFPRIKCPYCGNGDHETLGYFEAEGIEGVKVYYCEECKHYLKVIDTRLRTIHDAETEDVLTLSMDSIAQQEGYL